MEPWDKEGDLQLRSCQPHANHGGFILGPALVWPQLRAMCPTCSWLIRSLQQGPRDTPPPEARPGFRAERDLPTETRQAAPYRAGPVQNLPTWFPVLWGEGPRWGRRRRQPRTQVSLGHTVIQSTTISIIHLGEQGQSAVQRGGDTLLRSHSMSPQSWVGAPGPQGLAQGSSTQPPCYHYKHILVAAEHSAPLHPAGCSVFARVISCVVPTSQRKMLSLREVK